MDLWKKLDKKKVIPIAVIGVLFLVLVIYCLSLLGQVNSIRNENLQLTIQLGAVTQERDILQSVNAELQDKVAILSDTVNNKVKEEEEREAEIARVYLPTGFPLRGTATYNEEKTRLDYREIAEFVAEPGTSIIATAEGTVSAVEKDKDYGYCVKVDHGNGYVSIYRNGAKPKVEVGDTVTTETELFVIDRGHEALGYQITENNQYIDPLLLMEIYG